MPKTKNIMVGDVVHVNVTKLTNHDEAIRYFLTDWKTKLLDVRCIGIERRPPQNGGTVPRSFIHVYVEWNECKWSKWIRLRFVNKGPGSVVSILTRPGYNPPTTSIPPMPLPPIPPPPPPVTNINFNQGGASVSIDEQPPTSGTSTMGTTSSILVDNRNDDELTLQEWIK